MTDLPKAYIYTDTELKALGIDPGNKPDRVAELQTTLDHFLKRPAMFVGRADDINGILLLTREYTAELCMLCGTLDIGHFWDTCKFGSIGIGRLKFKGKWPNQINRTPEEVMEALKSHLNKLYKWLPNNRVLLKLDIPLDNLVFEDHRIADDLIKNHPNVIAAKQQLTQALTKINGNMTYVFVEGPSFCSAWPCPKLKITALHRPIHPESSYRTKTIELGFVD